MDSTTVGGAPKSGSVTTFALICACPEKETLSGDPLTIPLIGTRAAVAVVVVVEDEEVELVVLAAIVACALADVAPHQRAVPIIATTSERKTGRNRAGRIVMIRSFSSEGSWLNGGRIPESHTLRRRDRRWQRPEERISSVIDLPAHQHGIVLMYGVVAVPMNIPPQSRNCIVRVTLPPGRSL
jgi:hypothetical protein